MEAIEEGGSWRDREVGEGERMEKMRAQIWLA